MAENDMESGQQSGAQGTPNPNASPGGVQQSSPVSGPSLADVLSRIDNLESQFRGVIQSGHDKGIARLGSQVNDLTKQLERLRALQSEGWSEQQALRLMQLEDASLPPQKEPQVTTPPKGTAGNQTQVAGVDMQAIISKLGLDANSAEITEIVRAGGDDIDIINKLTQLAVTKRQAQANVKPAPAQQVATTGGGSSPPEKDLMAQYQAERDKPGRTTDEIINLRAKYRRLGLDI